MDPDSNVPVIDLFAGPGGLGEGFSALGHKEGNPRFRICLSIEKDPSAHETLELRAFFRQFPYGEVPSEYYQHLRGTLGREDLFNKFRSQARDAQQEAWHLELGKANTSRVRSRIRQDLRAAEKWVLIGGPPCQAYSLAGRSRNKGEEDYDPIKDEKQYLYEEYLQIIADHRPPVFVMENVKGLLSATLNDQRMFDRILDDLHSPVDALTRERRSVATGRKHRYRIYSLVSNGSYGDGVLTNYVVRAEQYGVPQARHRVILLGIRDDLRGITPDQLDLQPMVSASKVLSGFPEIRSGLSDGNDGDAAWLACLRDSLNRRWIRGVRKAAGSETHDLIIESVSKLASPPFGRGSEFIACETTSIHEPDWFIDKHIGGVCNHAARTHMRKDLHRYLYAACFAQIHERSPRLRDFPLDLLPDHENVPKALNGGFFSDRFRVQLAGQPSRTVTSHIAKDGHYYIHYSPNQCRALTVREAARLQTFPDNYFFCGNRTSQYIQVGNAVPPLLARAIASIVRAILK